MRRFFKTLAGPLALFALLFTGTAHAADIWTPPSTDWLMVNVMPLFGGGSDPTTSPFNSLFQILNTAMLTLGGLLAAYVMITGVMATAHDGEMMGRNMSSMWMPIRLIVGTALVLPVKGGFCLAQLIVLWLATQGIGLADTVWSQYLSNYTTVPATYSSPALDAKTRALFRALVLSNVCYESIRGEHETGNAEQQATDDWANGGSLTSSVGSNWFSNLDANGAGTVGYTFGSTLDGGTASACGTVTATLKGKTASTTSTATTQTATALLALADATPSVEQAHITALKTMQTAADNLARLIVNNGAGSGAIPPATLNATIASATSAYASTVNSAANSAFQSAMSSSNLASKMAADGFAMAGSQYTSLVRAKADMAAAAANVPTGIDGMKAGTSKWLAMFDNQTDGDVKRTAAMFDAADAQAAAKSGATANSDDNFSKVVNLFAGHGFSLTGSSTQDPLMNAYDIGQGLVTTVEGAGVAAMGLSQLAAIPWVGNGVSAAMSLFSGLFTVILLMLLTPALFLCFVLPMMPFFIVSAAVFGWLVMLFESLVAVPLWAVAFLSQGHGTDGVGSQKQGLMLILDVTMRPVLITLGIVGAYTVEPVLGKFVQDMFSAAFGATAGGGGFFELLRMLAGAVLYTVALTTAVYMSLKLVSSVPDNVLNWIGGGAGAVLGGHAETASRGLTSAAAAGGAAAGSVAGAALKGVAGAGNDMRKAALDAKREDERDAKYSERAGRTEITDPSKRTPTSGGEGSLKEARAQADGKTGAGNAGNPSAGTAANKASGDATAPAAVSPDREAAITERAPDGSSGTGGGGAAGGAPTTADRLQRLDAGMERVREMHKRLVDDAASRAEGGNGSASQEKQDAPQEKPADGNTSAE
ncbi:DotA/TraY family protein [Paraburkholderia tropica]|uniref:DotA/TraY family protein n=1 Tax=Paraburkholderia tropica TaxID=92647 RepID=UPI0031E062D9